MKRRFIILTDLSQHSANLLRYACEWAKEVNAELLLVHQTVILTPALTDSETRYEHTIEINDEALRKLKNLSHEFVPPGVNVSFSVSDDHLQNILKKLLEEPYENLIFTGIKGTSLTKKIFYGSAALQIIDKTKNIIVSIPKKIGTFLHEKIYVAVTKKYPLNILELYKFLDYIKNGNISITFFYLAKPDEKTRDIEQYLVDLSKLFKHRVDTNFKIFEAKNHFEDIQKVITDAEYEILVVQKGPRLLADRLSRKFLIEGLVYKGQTPLIILP